MEVWVEKYRPKKLDDVIGQDVIIKGLKSYVEKKDMPNIMFSGPPGIGKTSTAISLVKELYGDMWRYNFTELNASVSKDTPVLVKINGEIERTNFEKLDRMYFGEKNELYKNVNNIDVLSIDNNLKICWKKVSKIVRHKVEKIMRIHLEGGTIELTGNHSIITFDSEGNLVNRSAKDIKEGELLISFIKKENNKDKFLLIDKDLSLEMFYGALGDNVYEDIIVKIERLIERLSDNGLYITKITKIEIINYNDYVYDFAVPDTEMFFAGNIPVLLHNSDERGIDVVRGKIKDFARSSPVGESEFKVIFLDESDALTPEAQSALRRTMENYTNICRFILSCNYSSKIIEPIQSRCSVYKFRRLPDSAIIERIFYIAKEENLDISPSAINAIKYVSQGDLRRAINALQSAAIIDKKIDANMIYQTSALAKPEDIDDLILFSLEGNFLKAHAKLNYLLDDEGLAGTDITGQVYRQIFNINIPDKLKVDLIDYIGEIDFRISEGSSERLQLGTLLSKFMLYGINKI